MTRRLLALAALLLLAAPASASAVVGGRAASEPYPWMTVLLRDGSFICGASLIDRTHVLTAAHCVTDDRGEALATSRFTLDTGATRAGDAPSSTAQVPARLVVHPGWDPSTFDNDVAVFTLPEPARRGSPIALAGPDARSAWEPGDEVRVIGFGTRAPLGLDPVGLTAGGPLSEVDVPVVADADCAAAYSGFRAATMVCAGEPGGGEDACQGDSGGPLMAATAQGRVQVGVVSYGFQCGFPESPGVYARVGEGPLQAFVREQAPGVTTTPPAPGPAPTTPPPSGSGTPAPGTTQPARRAVRIRSTRLSIERGRVPVRLTCTGRSACRGTVRLVHDGRTAGRARYRLAAGRRGTVRVRPARRLRRATRATVRVSVAGGRTVARRLPVRR